MPRKRLPYSGIYLPAFGGAVSAFSSPSDISGLLAWYDFSDVSTLYQDSSKTTPVASDGDVIGAAENKASPGTYDATQATTAAKFIYKVNIRNGLSVAYTDGTDNHLVMGTTILSTSASDDLAIFCTRYNDRTAGNASVVFAKGDNDYQVSGFYIDGTASQIIYNRAGVDVINVAGITTQTWGLASYMRLSNTATAYNNGTLNDTDASANHTDNSENSYLGRYEPSGSSFKGYLGEFIIYQATLSATDRQNVEAYLATKWGF